MTEEKIKLDQIRKLLEIVEQTNEMIQKIHKDSTEVEVALIMAKKAALAEMSQIITDLRI